MSCSSARSAPARPTARSRSASPAANASTGCATSRSPNSPTHSSKPSRMSPAAEARTVRPLRRRRPGRTRLRAVRQARRRPAVRLHHAGLRAAQPDRDHQPRRRQVVRGLPRCHRGGSRHRPRRAPRHRGQDRRRQLPVRGRQGEGRTRQGSPGQVQQLVRSQCRGALGPRRSPSPVFPRARRRVREGVPFRTATGAPFHVAVANERHGAREGPVVAGSRAASLTPRAASRPSAASGRPAAARTTPARSRLRGRRNATGTSPTS
jgi:hypothetical protein